MTLVKLLNQALNGWELGHHEPERSMKKLMWGLKKKKASREAYSPILSSQIACRKKPNKITKITAKSSVADFNIFIIIIIRKVVFSVCFYFYSSPRFSHRKTFLFYLTNFETFSPPTQTCAVHIYHKIYFITMDQ